MGPSRTPRGVVREEWCPVTYSEVPWGGKHLALVGNVVRLATTPWSPAAGSAMVHKDSGLGPAGEVFIPGIQERDCTVWSLGARSQGSLIGAPGRTTLVDYPQFQSSPVPETSVHVQLMSHFRNSQPT